MAEKTITRNAGGKRGGKKGHDPAKTCFKKGHDPKRNTSGQRNKAAVQQTKLFRDILVAIGEEELTVENKETGAKIAKKKIEWLGQKLWSTALNGNMTAITIILERTEGKVTQPIDHSGDLKTNNTVTVKVIHVQSKKNGKKENGSDNK